jgi:hypothetical protein
MKRPAPNKRSRGLTVIAVIVCLILITLISLAMLKLGLAQHTQVRAQEHRLQAEWLAESGMQRALAALARDREYAGETWPIQARDLSLPEAPVPDGAVVEHASPAAIVLITVERPPGFPDRRLIHVRADFPPDAPRRARHSKQRLIDLHPDNPGAPS